MSEKYICENSQPFFYLAYRCRWKGTCETNCVLCVGEGQFLAWYDTFHDFFSFLTEGNSDKSKATKSTVNFVRRYPHSECRIRFFAGRKLTSFAMRNGTFSVNEFSHIHLFVSFHSFFLLFCRLLFPFSIFPKISAESKPVDLGECDMTRQQWSQYVYAPWHKCAGGTCPSSPIDVLNLNCSGQITAVRIVATVERFPNKKIISIIVWLYEIFRMRRKWREILLTLPLYVTTTLMLIGGMAMAMDFARKWEEVYKLQCESEMSKKRPICVACAMFSVCMAAAFSRRIQSLSPHRATETLTYFIRLRCKFSFVCVYANFLHDSVSVWRNQKPISIRNASAEPQQKRVPIVCPSHSYRNWYNTLGDDKGISNWI